MDVSRKLSYPARPRESEHFSVVVTVLVLLLAVLGLLIPTIMFRVFPNYSPEKIATIFMASGSALWGVVIGALAMAIVVALRLDELAVTMVIAVELYVDWYLGLGGVSHFIALVLLIIIFLRRSKQHPWVEPRALWLWGLFLALALLPAFRGLTLSDSLSYYLDVILGPLLIFWLGIVIAQDTVHVRRFLKIFSAFATLIAIHAVIEATTGVFLLRSNRHDLFLNLVADNFALGGNGAYRIGSFFVNPDTSGGFFAVVPFLPLGLFATSSSLLEKALYLVEAFLILLALLFTYSTGALIAAGFAFIVFVVVVGRMHYRILLPLLAVIATVVIVVSFPTQISLQIQHALAPGEASLRFSAWQTGIQVIRAFPLTGIGLGSYVYYERANPYRVPGEYIHLYHPHNSYLELAALGGIPVFLAFAALLLLGLYLALRNWAWADMPTRALLGGAIAAVAALSANSMVNPAWTLAPLAPIGWLLLGVISSPLLMQSLKHKRKNMEKLV